MAEKKMSFAFVLSAALSSNFSSSFAKASQQIELLSQHMDKMKEQAARLKGAFDSGIINEKTFRTAQMLSGQKAARAYGAAAKGAFEDATKGAGLLYYKAQSLASMFAAPAQAAIQFESSMADVKKVVDFKTPQQFKEMSDDILELSKRIPMTADALAQIVAAGGQSGIERESLTSFAESAAKMGVAFDITAEQAGDMMAKWRTAFKMNQEEVVKLADKVNYLGNTTAASAPLISDVVTRIGPLGEVGGVASGEIAALGASMVGSGIQSEVAATGIKNLILSLTAGESATKSQKEALQGLGLESEVVAKNMQSDAKGTILQVLSSIQALSKEKQAAALSELFGKESLSAIAPLLSNLDGLKENLDKVADAQKYTGSMEGEFAARSATTANSIQLMSNRANAAQIAIGNGLLPVIAPAMEIIGGLATRVGELATNYPGLTQGVIIATGAFATLYGVIAAGKIIAMEMNAVKFTYLALMKSSIAKTIIASTVSKASAAMTGLMTSAQWALNAAMTANPIGLVIAGIAALIAIGYVLYQNWDTISAFASTMWEGGKQAIANFGETIMNKISSICDTVTQKWQSLKDFLSHPIDTLVRYNQSLSGGGEVAQNAEGGIYKKGAFLTTFAEESPEAAIPLDGSARAVSLWERAGHALGVLGRGDGGQDATEREVSSWAVFNEYHEEGSPTDDGAKPWAFLGRAIDAMSGSASPAVFNEYHSTVFSKEPQEEKRETNESTKPWAFLGRAIDAMSGSASPSVFNEYHSTVFSKEPQEEKRETNESTKPWAFLGRAIDAMSGSVSPAVFNEYHEEGSPAGDEGGLASLWERAVDALAERSSGSISVNYSPNVTIQGNADQSTVERALSISRRELERMLAEISTDRRRLSYE